MRAIELDEHLSAGDVLANVQWANEVQIPNLATRRAILRLLAHLPGLTLRLVHDRLGRPGFAITERSIYDGCDYIYIFDTRTGELLASETMMITHGPGAASVVLPALAEARLFHRRAFVATATPA